MISFFFLFFKEKKTKISGQAYPPVLRSNSKQKNAIRELSLYFSITFYGEHGKKMRRQNKLITSEKSQFWITKTPNLSFFGKWPTSSPCRANYSLEQHWRCYKALRVNQKRAQKRAQPAWRWNLKKGWNLGGAQTGPTRSGSERWPDLKPPEGETWKRAETWKGH